MCQSNQALQGTSWPLVPLYINSKAVIITLCLAHKDIEFRKGLTPQAQATLYTVPHRVTSHSYLLPSKSC